MMVLYRCVHGARDDKKLLQEDQARHVQPYQVQVSRLGCAHHLLEHGRDSVARPRPQAVAEWSLSWDGLAQVCFEGLGHVRWHPHRVTREAPHLQHSCQHCQPARIIIMPINVRAISVVCCVCVCVCMLVFKRFARGGLANEFSRCECLR